MGFGNIGRGTSQIIADACRNSQIHVLYPILATVVELSALGCKDADWEMLVYPPY